jgi:hypothetical protein
MTLPDANDAKLRDMLLVGSLRSHSYLYYALLKIISQITIFN